MQEYRLILSQATESDIHYISRTSQARLSMSDNAATLPALRLQPLIHEIEVLAAVVDLAVVISRRLPASEDRHILEPAVAHARQVLRDMHRRIRVVPPAQQ